VPLSGLNALTRLPLGKWRDLFALADASLRETIAVGLADPVPAHLPQPRRRHRRPDTVVVDKHDAGSPDRDKRVGLLRALPIS
jgi:hypothetical protein